jgi:hypothetical protein
MKNDNNFSGQTIALNLKNLRKLSINQILFHRLGVGGTPIAAGSCGCPSLRPLIIEGHIKDITL